MSSPSTGSARDLRIDVFRGIALLLILWAHLRWRMLGAEGDAFRINPGSWALVDSADMFVFLSGYVYGLAYRRVYDRGGLWAVISKSFLRAWDLYVVNLLTFALAVAVSGWFYLRLAPETTAPIDGLGRLFERPLETLASAPLLNFQIPYFDVLVLYIGLLLVAPLLYAALRWQWWAGVGLSAALYLAAQSGVRLFPGFFNMLGWQFLFTLAMAVSTYRPRIPKRKAWFVAVLALVLVPTVSVRLMHPLALRGIVPDLGWFAIMEWAEKTSLAPFRILYFACLLYLVYCVTRAEGRIWASTALDPFRTASKHSLGVFAFGIFATYVGFLTSHALATGPAGAAVILVAACAASLGIGYALEWRQRQRQLRPTQLRSLPPPPWRRRPVAGPPGRSRSRPRSIDASE